MSFKMKFTLVLFVLLTLGLTLLMTGPDGRPLMSLDDWVPDTSQLPALPESAPTTLSASSGKMYKWQDEKGRWHFSYQKPAAMTRVSVEELPEVENVIEAPVNKGDNSSSIRFPGGFNLGQ